MRIFWATYNNKKEEAEICLHKEFLTSPYVMQLDCLQDVISELQQTYDELIKREERMKKNIKRELENQNERV